MSAQQLFNFYHRVAENDCLYTLIDDSGIPTPADSSGQKTMPFWSSEQKALEFVSNNPSFAGFKPYPVDWQTFQDKWFAGIVADDLMVGIDWVDYFNENLVIEVEILQREVHAIRKVQAIKKATQ